MKKLFTSLLIILGTGLVTNSQVPNFNVTVNTGALQGYFYFVPYKLSSFPSFPAGSQNQMIIDQDGHVVYYKPVSGYFAGDFKMHKNGWMSYAAGNQFYIMDSTFTVVDSVAPKNGLDFDLHDLQILPNGHYLLLASEDVTRDLSSYNFFTIGGTPGVQGSANATVIAGVVQELDSAKNVVFEWHSIDYFNFSDVDEFFMTDSANVDWTHMNSVEMDADSNIIISSRHFSEITKINRSDSSIIWHLGGKANDFNFINDSSMFLAQHDARRLPNGHLLLFDNGRANPLHINSSKEYDLDEVGMVANLVWSHNEGPTVFSRSQGNCQRLANGMTLTSYGNPINENIVFNVVDSMNNKVFEVSFPDTQITYRTFFYENINVLSNQPLITCHTDSLTADSGSTSYMWSTGDTTPSIFVNTNDTFWVYVPVGDSGYISSDLFIVTDSSNICSPLAITEISRGKMIAYPNPANDHLYVKLQEELPMDMYDVTGRQIMHFAPDRDQISIDVSSLQPGVYILRAGKYSMSFIKS